ncbi:MAG: MFS transporter [Streptosporangiales bacterium]|nr:MFS transporter [Streptosporangiales bacterium]
MTEKQQVMAQEVTEKDARRALAAAGIGWGLDGLTWTMYAFALTAVMPVLGISEGAAGWITAVSIGASAVGGVVCGSLADRFGRVRVLTWVIVGYCVFTALTATAQDLTQFAFWRVLEGFTFGGEWAVGAALIAEYAAPHRRGRVLAFVQSCYAIGWAISTGLYLVVFSLAPENVAWRYLFLVGVVPAVAAFVIRRTTRDRVQVAPKRREPFGQLFQRQTIKTTVLATGVGLGIQGIYYSVFVFMPLFLRSERGLSVIGTATYTWVVIVGSFLGYVASGFVHDTIGRRPTFTLFFAGSAGAIALFVFTPVVRPELGYVISFLLGFFASGQAGGMGAYLAELFPTHVRASGQGFAYNVGRGVAGFGPLTIGVLAAGIGFGAAIAWVGFVAAAVGILTVWSLPETKARNILKDVVSADQGSR